MLRVIDLSSFFPGPTFLPGPAVLFHPLEDHLEQRLPFFLQEAPMFRFALNVL